MIAETLARHRDRARDPGGRRAADAEGIRARRPACSARRRGSASAASRCRCCSPSIQTALILRTVLAFEMFAVVLAIGGRNFPVLVSEAFTWQYQNQDYGVAAAYAVLVMAGLAGRDAGLSAWRCGRAPEKPA